MELFRVLGVFQREHWYGVRGGGKLFCGWCADLLTGGIRCDDLRVLLFDVLQLAEQSIVFGVGDFRLILAIVKLVVTVNFFAEVGVALLSEKVDHCMLLQQRI